MTVRRRFKRHLSMPWGGVRTGIPGQPFDVALELDAMAEARLSDSSRTTDDGETSGLVDTTH